MAEAGGAAWKNGLFGCFGNCKTCLVTYVAPCYTFGKIAEKVTILLRQFGVYILFNLNFTCSDIKVT